MTGPAAQPFDWVSNPSGTALETFSAFAMFLWKLCCVIDRSIDNVIFSDTALACVIKSGGPWSIPRRSSRFVLLWPIANAKKGSSGST